MKRKTKKMNEQEFESKRAIAPIISMVLLLGLAVALGTGVYLWQVRQTEKLGSSVVRFASGVMDCQELTFNVYARDGCTKTTVQNTGYFSADGFVVRSFSSFGDGSEVKEVFVKAKESDVLDLGLVNADRIEVMPVVKVEDELVGCKDRVREVFCEGLDDLQVLACETADDQGTCDSLDGSDIVTRDECCTYLSPKCCV